MHGINVLGPISYWGKPADRIWMPFGTIGRTGPGTRQVVEFGDRSTGRGTFGFKLGLKKRSHTSLVSETYTILNSQFTCCVPIILRLSKV